LAPKKDLVFSAGFGKQNDREFALFDPRKLDKPISSQIIDSSSSTLMPFFDPDLSIMYLAGKGDGNIRIYEIGDDEPFVHFLTEYKSKDPQSGIAVFPKQVCDVMKTEVLRVLKLTPSGVVVPIKFVVPRQDNLYFQEDLFPDTWDLNSAMTAEEWFSGASKKPNLISLNPEKK